LRVPADRLASQAQLWLAEVAQMSEAEPRNPQLNLRIRK